MSKPTILVIDPSEFNREFIKEFLAEASIITTASGKEGLQSLKQTIPHLILLELQLPDIDGINFLAHIQPLIKKYHIPVLVLVSRKLSHPQKIKLISLGCYDFIMKPIDITELQLRVKHALEFKTYQEDLERKIAEKTQELQKAYKALQKANQQLKKAHLEIINILGKVAELKDEGTGAHIIRTSKYVEIIARALDLPKEQCEMLFLAAPLHDVGKICIPEVILLKKGKLTDEEFEIMKLHTKMGAAILEGIDVPLIKTAREIALTHHEKWDGTGYPQGLKGTEIPLSGRIMAIADVFDALSQERPYKKAWPIEQIMNYFFENMGRHFDPQLVDIFAYHLDEFLKVRDELKDTETTHSELAEFLEKIKWFYQKTLGL
jgi:putative two-component system response regulator